ncbi:MAG: hypothetical protein WA916_07335 [Arcobacter sp.]|uniref:beta family protein n=1 Tax=Arcobacter sp. TaxID=1872629 RepID=UPI003C796861
MKYVPFLKLKTNEIRAINDLDENINNNILPFFDVTYRENMTEDLLEENIIAMKKHLANLLGTKHMYIDDYDHIDADYSNYYIVLDNLRDLNIIPVISLNREKQRLDDVKYFIDESVENDRLAIRLFLEDIEAFRLIKDDFLEHYEYFSDKVKTIDIIIDLRVIIDERIDYLKNRVNKFLNEFNKEFSVNKIIITGSSLKNNIATNSEEVITRHEYLLWDSLQKDAYDNLVFGDYTIVSPDYVAPTMAVNLMPNVMTPKVFYTYKDKFFAKRGSAFKTHKDGYGQYFTIAQRIILKRYFRGKDFSEGDKYIYERGIVPRPVKIKSGGSPSSWIRATINSHVTYMTNHF